MNGQDQGDGDGDEDAGDDEDEDNTVDQRVTESRVEANRDIALQCSEAALSVAAPSAEIAICLAHMHRNAVLADPGLTGVRRILHSESSALANDSESVWRAHRLLVDSIRTATGRLTPTPMSTPMAAASVLHPGNGDATAGPGRDANRRGGGEGESESVLADDLLFSPSVDQKTPRTTTAPASISRGLSGSRALGQ